MYKILFKFALRKYECLSNLRIKVTPKHFRSQIFTNFLAQSVQELWPIIISPATIVNGTGVKGIYT